LFIFSKSDYEEIAQFSQLMVDSQEKQKVEDQEG